MNETLNIFSAHELDRIKEDAFVRTVELHREAASTSDLALRHAAADTLETPLLVVAETQTAGGGRGDNRWWSPHGALAFSLVVDAQACRPPGDGGPRVCLATALAVREALSAGCPLGQFRLKWPNDVMLSERKVAGILLELPPRRADRLVIGVGINVNNSLSQAPNEIRTTATSLFDQDGTRRVLSDVLRTVLQRMAACYRALVAGELRLAEQWREVCFLRGRLVTVAAGQRLTAGVCHGIDEQGALLIQNDSGLHRVLAGIVQQVHPNAVRKNFNHE
jgi:BirA family transcriptional regulator, biotin operon repressor / biotin---[acetyl-CoA-carboxylase] ligase